MSETLNYLKEGCCQRINLCCNKGEKMKYYAIGDVHGEYETLEKLVEQLPKKAQLFFVGDLIDRGPDSKKVVDFVREGNHRCVLGNHEDMMIKEAEKMRRKGTDYTADHLWVVNGGVPTLESYDIIREMDDGQFIYTKNKSSIEKFIDDAEWMSELPLYIKAAVKWQDVYDIVITHTAMGDTIWPMSKEREDSNFKDKILWNREQRGANPTFNMFNVFGHTPQKNTRYVTMGGGFLGDKNFMNIDSGCVYDKEGLGKLTALNLETLETVFQDRV